MIVLCTCMDSPPFMRLPAEIQPGIVLELPAALLAVRLPPHHDEWGRKADDLEISAKFVGVPDLAVVGLLGLAAAGCGVDLGHSFTANCFGPVVHCCSSWVMNFSPATHLEAMRRGNLVSHSAF